MNSFIVRNMPEAVSIAVNSLACSQALLWWDWGERGKRILLLTKPLYVDRAPFSTEEPARRL